MMMIMKTMTKMTTDYEIKITRETATPILIWKTKTIVKLLVTKLVKNKKTIILLLH